MYIYKNTLLIILSSIGVLLSESGYNTIYLMEFENQENEFTNSHLTEALPDLIKENYKFREDINVEYSGDIRPYLEQKVLNDENPIKIKCLFRLKRSDSLAISNVSNKNIFIVKQ